jgi:predicted cation transporter
VEEELEVFLFLMGVISVSISKLWTWHLASEALREPVVISLAVLVAGILFRIFRVWLRDMTKKIIKRFGMRVLIFLLVTGLGLLSSIITAIIAALILSEIVTLLKLQRKLEIKIVVITCFAIGLGAVLTPLGEPLATIAVAKLRPAPHHADIYFLFHLLGLWIIPAVIGLGILAAAQSGVFQESTTGLREDRQETIKDVLIRAVKVYFFVMGLILLGVGFTPMVEKYLLYIPAWALYWINMVSAVLDNATLTAAEITPLMSRETIRYLLLGLLISGGMLIPGNIPNIICAGKLSIRSKEWVKTGVPLGLLLLIGYFIVLIFGAR